MANELLSTNQLGRHIGVAPATILLWVKRRGLPCRRFSKRTIRFDPAEVDRWLAQQNAKATPDAATGKGGVA